MKKKADSLSMNIIVVAAIALLILVVMVVIFTGQIGGKNKQINLCSTNNGQCMDREEAKTACVGEFQKVNEFYTCLKDDQKTRNYDEVCCQTIIQN